MHKGICEVWYCRGEEEGTVGKVNGEVRGRQEAVCVSEVVR